MNPKDQRFEASFMDYGLSMVASASAAIAAAFALQVRAASLIFGTLIIIGHLVSWRIRLKLDRKEPATPIDGLIFAVVFILCMFFAPQMNAILPEGGYAANLLQTSVLSWMLALGSFLAWRDSTLLFLAVPGIALFGLVGAYDTLTYAPLVFFLFLICAGVLFARSNLRAMLRRAEASHQRTQSQLDRYEWRAIAGPEWAFGSALVVIALSWLGAPIIRTTVGNAAAALGTQTQLNPFRNTPNRPNSSGMVNESVPVGRGPFGKPSDAPALLVRMDRAEYLRGKTYDTFREGRWYSTFANMLQIPTQSRGLFNAGAAFRTRDVVPDGEPIRFEVEVIGAMVKNIFVPGQPAWIRTGKEAIFSNADLAMVPFPLLNPGDRYQGVTVVPNILNRPASSVPPPGMNGQFSDLYTRYSSTDRVRELAERVTEGAENDYEKAKRLQAEVTRRITYNLQAAELPPGDPIEQVLFSTREGYCDLFASSLTQLARAVGLHARVATGYLVDAGPQELTQGVTLRDRDYHMWSEIYFDGVGWVTFDATEGANEVPGAGRGSAWREPAENPGWTTLKVLGAIGGIALAALLIRRFGPRVWRSIVKFIVPESTALDRTPEELVLVKAQTQVARLIRQTERISRTPRRFETTASQYLHFIGSVYELAPEMVSGTATLVDRALYAPSRFHSGELETLSKNIQEYLAAVKQARKESKTKR